MSRHPYYIVDDFLKQAGRFCAEESILISPAPPDGDYPFLKPVYQLEQALALSGYYCLIFHREYWDRVRGMRPGPYPLEVRRAIEQIRKAIEVRFARWGWDKFLESQGVNGVKYRMVAHSRATYDPLLDAALSWRSAIDVSLEEEPYSKCADRLAHYAEGVLLDGPSLTPEEGKRLFPERHGAWYMSPALGTSIPSVTSEEHGLLHRAFDVVSAYHAQSVSPEELKREWTQLEQQVRESPYPIPGVGHYPDKESLNAQEELQQGEETRILAYDGVKRAMIPIDRGSAKSWEGRWSDPYYVHAWRYNLLLTQCGKWILNHQIFSLGDTPHPSIWEKGTAYEIVSRETAAAWFTKNGYPHPPELLDAFEPSPARGGIEPERADEGCAVAYLSSQHQPTRERAPETAGSGVPERLTRDEEIEVLRQYLKTASRPTIREAAQKLGRSLPYTQKLPPWLEHMARKRRGRKSQSVSGINLDDQVLEAHSGGRLRESTRFEPTEIDERLDAQDPQRELEKLIGEQREDDRSRYVR